MAEVLEGSSSEDETFGRIFPRSRTRRGEEFFPFPRPFRGRDEEFLGISAFFSAILRTRLLILVFRGRGRDEARNFAPFLGHFEVETRPSRTSVFSSLQNAYLCPELNLLYGMTLTVNKSHLVFRGLDVSRIKSHPICSHPKFSFDVYYRVHSVSD